jgi:outer membrane protein TolC
MPRSCVLRSTFAASAAAFLLAAPAALAQRAAPTSPPPTPAPVTTVPAASSGQAAQPSGVPPLPDAPRLPTPDPQVGGEAMEKVTFDEAIRRTLGQNPTILQAAEEVHRYHALMEEVRASSLPVLTAGGMYTRLDGNRVEDNQVAVPRSLLNLNLSLNAPLIYPRGWVQWGQASDQVDVARANEADVRRTLAVAAARAYLTIITQKRLVETARIARDSAKGHYEFTRAQRIGGIGNNLDETRAAQELTTDEVNLQNQKIALVRAREALGILMGSDAPVDNADESTPNDMPSFGDAMNAAEKVRADVRARRRAAEASQRTVDDAYADYLPYLNLLAEPFYQHPYTESSQFPDAVLESSTYPNWGWEAELVLTLPLYDGGLRYGQEHERKALASEAKINVEGTLRQAKSDVRTAFEEIREADIALDQARQSSAFAKHALDLANLAYRAGATTNLEVIDAERQARDAETQQAIAEDAAREARVDLLAASGHFP